MLADLDLDRVTLARGLDYSDVSLLRGVILGGREHCVKVAVTVTQGELRV